MAYVYQHIRLDTDEVFYIGIGTDSNGKYKRANRKTHRSEYWNNIVNKAGYRVEILTDGITKDEAAEEEKRLIKHYGRRDINTGILVNMTDGGEGTIGIAYREPWNKGKTDIYNEEVREKIRESNRRRIYSAETRKKISESRKNIEYKMRTDWLDENTPTETLKSINELAPIDYLLATLIGEKIEAGVDVEYWNSILNKYKWNGRYTQLKRLRDKIKYLIQISQNQIHKSSDTLDK